MKLSYSVRDATKAGNQRSEMEDAAYPAAGLRHEGAAFACAIADGATQGSHSGPWARVLCERFAGMDQSQEPDALLAALVPAAREAFAAWEAEYLAERNAKGRALAWFEAEVMGSGAFATLVGVHLEDLPGGGVRFRALAVGDSCLFVLRQGKIEASFPLTVSSQFSGAPLLLASLAASSGLVASTLKTLTGELTTGDGLLLATDALSAWAMRALERGEDPVPTLLGLVGGDERTAFDDFLAAERREKRLRNDDVTLVHVSLEA